MGKAVVLFSGGLDSATLLFDYLSRGIEVFPLSINYGQRHVRELGAAQAVMSWLGQSKYKMLVNPYRQYDVPVGLLGGSSLLGEGDIPEGHYEAESMKSTVVPNRNMILISLAVGYALTVGADVVAFAAHAGDHAIYPDCRPEFFESMRLAVWGSTDGKVTLQAPFIQIKKHDIVKIGAHLGVPYQLTWSCYNGRVCHCGKCGTCVERREAFKLAKHPDPTEYEA